MWVATERAVPEEKAYKQGFEDAVNKAIQFLEREYTHNSSMAVIDPELIESFKQYIH